MMRQQKPDFQEIVGVLVERAQHLLVREGDVGRSMAFHGKDQISPTELIDWLTRLQKSAGDLLEYETRVPSGGALAKIPDGDNFLQNLFEARFSQLSPGELEATLEAFWQELQDRADQILTARSHLIAETGDPALPLDIASSEEIDFLSDPSDRPDREELICLARHDELLARTITETRAILAGHFDSVTQQRGAPEKRRGRWLAAHLIGIAEGMGLNASRNHAPNVNSPLESATDAFLCALKQIDEPKDPAARKMWRSAPRSLDTILRRLLPCCDPESGSEADLATARRVGRSLGARGGGIPTLPVLNFDD